MQFENLEIWSNVPPEIPKIWLKNKNSLNRTRISQKEMQLKTFKCMLPFKMIKITLKMVSLWQAFKISHQTQLFESLVNLNCRGFSLIESNDWVWLLRNLVISSLSSPSDNMIFKCWIFITTKWTSILDLS